MASITEILRTLNNHHIYVNGVGEIAIDTESICVGNNAVIARCHIVGAEDDGSKLLRCYTRWRNPLQSKYDPTFIPKAITIYTLMGQSQEIDISLSEWHDGTTLDKYLEHDAGNYDRLSRSMDALARIVISLPYAHGDIQPENILIREDGSMQLIDYDTIWEAKFIEDIHEGHFDIRPDSQHIDRVNRQNDYIAVGYLSVMLATMALIEKQEHNGNRVVDHTLFAPYRDDEDIYADLQRAQLVLGNGGDTIHYYIATALLNRGCNLRKLLTKYLSHTKP